MGHEQNSAKTFDSYLFLAVLMYFVLMGEWSPPEKAIHTRGKTFQPAKKKAHVKAC